ncbi:retrotransposon gag protein [Cucumis melo var. makuwa]|nr:retrotransposon gag protein [Cucumis melo var. makuwa]
MGEVREKTLRELAEPDEDQRPIYVATGGALADKIPTEARELISRMVENSQSFGNRASELDNSLTKEILDTPTTKEKKVTSKSLPLNSKNEFKEEKVETNPSPSNSKNDKSPLNDFTPYIPKPPFPSRLTPKKKETPKEEELLEVFRKVQINLPLLDAIQQVLRYAKFLKELRTNKRKTKEIGMEIG